MFSGASHVAISGGTFINQTSSEKSGLERLSATAAHSALHDAPARTDETRCLKDTRTKVLDHLERWAQGLLDEEASIFWLHGGAGAGKSAIMQTLAERLVAKGLALGSFFFWRGDPTRNTANVLIPTLVYQLAQLFPSSLEVLDPIIDRDPLIFNKNLQVQLLNLLVLPLQHLGQLGNISDDLKSPRVFLVDGLDECSDPTQQQAIIQAAAAVCHEHHIPVKFLIASRPEKAISTSFGLYEEANYVLGVISLSEDPNARSDIHRFIKAELLRIRLQHPFKRMIPSEWPDWHDIYSLVEKSSSHFIYASTAMKYIWSANESPVRSLQVVLGLELTRTISPFSELDALYHHILRSSAYLNKVLQVIAHCIYSYLYSRFSPASIICFMLDCSEDDLFIYLADMTPLVVICKSERRTGDFDVRLLHASLSDFFHDQSRSGSLYINEEVYLASKLERCCQLADISYQGQQLEDGVPFIWDIHLIGDDLYAQIHKTVLRAGHLAVTQEVLRRYSLLKFFEWRLYLTGGGEISYEVLADFFWVFLGIHSIKTPSDEGTTLFRSSAENFLNTLDNHISLQKMPLVAATFRFLFSGYPENAFDRVLRKFLRQRLSPSSVEPSKQPFGGPFPVISAAQLGSIQQDLNTSSECFLVGAVETILQYVFDDGKESWLDRRRLAPDLFDALVWALPKVGASQTIQLYSKTTQAIRWDWGADHDIAIRVADCLDEYNTRMQTVKLAHLEQSIQNGVVDAVIEKSSMLVINDQD